MKSFTSVRVTGLKMLGRFEYGLRLYMCNLVSGFPSSRLRHLIYRKAGRMSIDLSSSIHRGAKFFCLGGISISAHCVINGNCYLDGRRGLHIGKSVSVSVGSRILTLGHDPQSSNFEVVGGEVVIEDFAWIGAFATILPNVRIGRGAVVGAGSVVTKNVPDYAIVAGIPAKVVGSRNQTLNYELDYSPLFF